MMQTNKVPLKLEAWFSRRSPNINIQYKPSFFNPSNPSNFRFIPKNQTTNKPRPSKR